VKALLLAAGLGTRLRPITDKIPKCMVPIHGKPLLAYWLDLLLPAGIEQVLINTHYLPDVVKAFIQSSPWRDRIVLVHEDILLGTGGTILKNREFLADGPFMLVHADNLTRFDVRAFLDAHAKRRAGVEITMMTFDTDTPQSCGIVEQDAQGVVVAFHEKSPSPPGNRANAAVYIFEPTVIGFLASLSKEFIDVSTEVLPHYLGRMQAFHNANYHRDIGTPESLRLAEQEFSPS
jgi:mannose-1-phosphate guanylyltransferase